MACVEIANGWQSPRISFSLDLSQADRISPDKRKREDRATIDYNTEFEFCIVSNVNDGREAVFGETLISADELFVDGKILPQIQAPEAQPQPITIARHLSLESSKCPSPVRSASYPPSKQLSSASGPGNVAVKSSSKSSGRWKEMFKLSNKEYFCAASKEAEEETKESNNAKPPPNPRSSLWPFSRSCSSGGETRGNGLFCSMPFSRSNSTGGERKSKPGFVFCYRSKSVGAQSSFKETETLLEGSQPAEASSVSCGIEPAPQKSIDLIRPATNAPGLPRRKSGHSRVTRTRGTLGSPARNFGRGNHGRPNGRFTVRNLERCSPKALDSPRPGRPMAEGLIKANSNSYSGGAGVSVRVNPVLNVPVCVGPVGGRNGPGLFGFRAFFSSKKVNTKRSHHSSASAASSNNRKEGA